MHINFLSPGFKGKVKRIIGRPKVAHLAHASQDIKQTFHRRKEEVSPEATPINMATLSTDVRVGVNFASSGQEDTIHAYYAIDPNDIIVSKWHLVRRDVLDILKELPWAVLSVVGCSFSPPLQRDPESNALIVVDLEPLPPKPESNPVLLIGAPAESHHSWQAMAEQIYLLCSNAGLGHCRVLFESAKHPLTGSTDFYNNPRLDAREFSDNVPLGSSFGPVNGDNKPSASMGGTIKLKGDGEESTLLLSVFHPFSDLVSPEERSHGWRYGSSPAIEVRMPSVEDTDRARQRLQNLTRGMRECIEDNKEAKDIPLEERSANHARFERKLGIYQKDLQKLEDYTSGDRGLGFLRYGSGFEKGFDWSLSSFDDRIINNSPPAEDDVNYAMEQALIDPETIGVALSRYKDSGEIALAKAEANSLVIKRGRTTGLRVGKVNTLPSDIVVSADTWKWKLNKKIGIEVCAILEGDNMFVQGGDLGAWVLNSDGDWIGSVIGAQSNGKSYSIGLAIEAEKIVVDIEEFTEEKVVSPKRKCQA